MIITDPATGAISAIHFMEVLNKLGIADQMKEKLVLHPDGGPMPGGWGGAKPIWPFRPNM